MSIPTPKNNPHARIAHNAWLCAAAMLLAVDCPALARPGRPLGESLTAITRSLPHRNTKAGVFVVDLATKRTVFSRNPDSALIPASTMKVFTMVTAVLELGESFVFRTVLALDGADLIVVADGDPAFGDVKTSRALRRDIEHPFAPWITAIKSAGIERIDGDIILDESVYDDAAIHPSWEAADLGKWYAAPVRALNINGNCLDITLTPTATGDAPRVSIRPDTRLASITNKCKTGSGRTPLLHHPPNTMEYIVSGRCAKTWAFGAVAFPDPGLLFGDAFKTALSAAGIATQGRVVFGRVRLPGGGLPPSAQTLAVHETPLSAVLARVGKNSQNLFAEALFKRAGYAWALRHGRENPVGSWANGARAVEAFAARAGLDTTGLVVSDGSGLSRANRCTARQLASVFSWIDEQPQAGALQDNLAIAGIDGSLRKRLKDLPGSVIGKTGTMRGVCSLAGWVLDRGGRRRFAFAIIFNDYHGPSAPYRELQDRICRVLVRATTDLSD